MICYISFYHPSLFTILIRKARGNKGLISLLPSPQSKGKQGSYFPSSIPGKQRVIRVFFPFFHSRQAKGNKGFYFPSSISGKQREIRILFPFLDPRKAKGNKGLISLLPSPEAKGNKGLNIILIAIVIYPCPFQGSKDLSKS